MKRDRAERRQREPATDVGSGGPSRATPAGLTSRRLDVLDRLTRGHRTTHIAATVSSLNAEAENGAMIDGLVEFGLTRQLFSRPGDERTEAYPSGRFG